MHSVLSDSLQPHALYSPWNSPGQNTGVGSCSLLQGIFPTQGLNPGLPHCRWILYQLSHQRSPRTLEWDSPSAVDLPNSIPRNWTRVSCIAGRVFTSWAKGARDNSISTCKEWSWTLYFITYTDINSTKICKTLRRKHRSKTMWLWVRQWFLRYDS